MGVRGLSDGQGMVSFPFAQSQLYVLQSIHRTMTPAIYIFVMKLLATLPLQPILIYNSALVLLELLFHASPECDNHLTHAYINRWTIVPSYLSGNSSDRGGPDSERKNNKSPKLFFSSQNLARPRPTCEREEEINRASNVDQHGLSSARGSRRGRKTQTSKAGTNGWNARTGSRARERGGLCWCRAARFL